MATPVGSTPDSGSLSRQVWYGGGRAMQPTTCPAKCERFSALGATGAVPDGPQAACASPSHAAVTQAHAAERLAGLAKVGQKPAVHHAASRRGWSPDSPRGQPVAGGQATLVVSCSMLASVPQPVKGVSVCTESPGSRCAK